MTTLTAAVIGCGSIGSSMQDNPGAKRRGICTHASAYQSHNRTELTALCDTNPNNLSQALNRWGDHIQGYSDVALMLQECQPDLVSVATHVDSHFEITQRCLLAPSVKAVLLEKPISNDLNEAYALRDLAEQSGKILTINYSRRFPKIFQQLASDFAQKRWGDVVHISGFYTKGLIHNGTHWLDMFRMFFGEPDTAQGFAKLSDPDHTLKNGDAMISFAMSSSQAPSVEVRAFPVSAHTIFDMDILLTKGRVRIIDQSDTIEIYQVKEDYPFVGYQALDLIETHQNCLKHFVAHGIDDLVQSVITNTPSSSPITSAIRNLELARGMIDTLGSVEICVDEKTF